MKLSEIRPDPKLAEEGAKVYVDDETWFVLRYAGIDRVQDAFAEALGRHQMALQTGAGLLPAKVERVTRARIFANDVIVTWGDLYDMDPETGKVFPVPYEGPEQTFQLLLANDTLIAWIDRQCQRINNFRAKTLETEGKGSGNGSAGT